MQPAGAQYFITFRLKGTLPRHVIERLKKEQEKLSKETAKTKELSRPKSLKQKRIFNKYEKLLDSASCGPTWLKEPKISDIVREAVFFRDKRNYDLYAFTIMSNHVHLVFKLLENDNNSDKFPVTKMLGELKSYSALRCNEHLGRSGAFWQSESYDHVIRDDDELGRVIRYVLNNPVKAGMVDDWTDWELTYCKPFFLKELI